MEASTFDELYNLSNTLKHVWKRLEAVKDSFPPPANPNLVKLKYHPTMDISYKVRDDDFVWGSKYVPKVFNDWLDVPLDYENTGGIHLRNMGVRYVQVEVIHDLHKSIEPLDGIHLVKYDGRFYTMHKEGNDDECYGIIAIYDGVHGWFENGGHYHAFPMDISIYDCYLDGCIENFRRHWAAKRIWMFWKNRQQK